jgi:ethanolamine utilization protein EutQ
MEGHNTSNEIILWKKDEIKNYTKGEPGHPITMLVNPSNSDTFSAGYFGWKNAHYDWTVKYDEVYFVTKGKVTLIHEGKCYEGEPGDVMFIRRGTPLTWDTDEDAEVIFALYPTWWRQQTGE